MQRYREESQVVKTFTENAHAITDVARQYRDEPFTISDLVADVDCSRETVRRTLNEFAAFGYLETRDEKRPGDRL
jgi:DNA-binding IscR family transcriptional regulator